MTVQPFRLGLVGCGRLAEVGYVPAVAAGRGDVRIVAVADPDPARCRGLASRIAASGCGPVGGGAVRTAADAGRLLDGGMLDGLVVASPASTHLAAAAQAATHGVATLVEKPPALDGAAAADLAALDPPPWVGFNRRFDPGAARVRAAVPVDGPVDLSLRLAYRRASWGAHAVRDDALLDLGPHLVDWARWITGAEVASVERAEVEPDRAGIELLLDHGRARLRAAADRPHAELIELRGPDGRLLARHRIGGLAAAVRGRLRRTGPTSVVATLTHQLGAFVAAARGDGGGPAAVLGSAADGLAAMRVVDAARACAATGVSVRPHHQGA